MFGRKKGRATMSVQEAGKLGGAARKQKLGSEGYSKLGHMGGQRVRELIEEAKSIIGRHRQPPPDEGEPKQQ
jgi:uncharacterized protein